MDAIVPLNNLTNRWQRRRFEKEALAVVEELETVNTEFLYTLFDEHNLKPYKELYIEFNDRWHETINNILNGRKIKHIGIDKLWFSENYKPLEQCRKHKSK